MCKDNIDKNQTSDQTWKFYWIYYIIKINVVLQLKFYNT